MLLRRKREPESYLFNGWVRSVPDRELVTIHHALRLTAKYPGLPGDEERELTRLADVCWDEHAARSQSRSAKPASPPADPSNRG